MLLTSEDTTDTGKCQDVEKSAAAVQAGSEQETTSPLTLTERELQIPPNPPGPYDDDPRDWSALRKAFTAVLVSLGQLVALMSASVVSPALPVIARDLGLGESTMQITFSIYMLGLGLGPFFIAACSETFGRRPIWFCSHVFYIFWNTLCPAGNSPPLMIAGRFLSGIGASVGVALSGPIVADMYPPEERGRSLAIATFAPYLGPALGPVLGGVMTQHTKWQWLFWVLSIFDAFVVLVAFFTLHETYEPILRRKQDKKEVGDQGFVNKSLDAVRRLKNNIGTPVSLLCRRPIVQVFSLLMGLSFGVYCITLSTFAVLWVDQYHQSVFISSLHYIAIAVGATLGSQTGGYLTDFIWRRLREKAGGNVTPEYRVPMMVPGVLLMPIGLLLYGWAAESKTHWTVVDLGVVVFVMRSLVWVQATMAYLLDEFVKHAASANAASRGMSYLLGFVFPIFAPQLYQKLGYGWGNSLLALLVVTLGWPMPMILWKFGARLRAISWGSEHVRR
ncbi:hypothetical protein PV08_04069 [Exophiala spinifera]|uniref:Major facilitator superfamily (MFS) profile domain-containing protein n=1 Tax=Exophiala spinifera TaxID=91928 RepID=A0A0D2BZV1_9EURO|nr:uncharacterized protein PV08_04069 [Exophiala spinifera]KIW16879.1 hypothetical protein PV08_04069 [Exophiala spinifera]